MQRKPTEIRQAQIVEAAMRIIATKGARKFTAQLLASEIGVSAGDIFRHFKSMDDIADAVIGRMEAMLFENFPPDVPDPIARLRVFFRQRVRTILANPHVSRMLLSDHLAQAGGRKRAVRVNEFKRRSQEFVLACLQEAAEQGELRGKAGPEEGMVIVLGSILALSHVSTRLADKERIEELSERVWSVIEHALRGAAKVETTRPPRAYAVPGKYK